MKNGIRNLSVIMLMLVGLVLNACNNEGDTPAPLPTPSPDNTDTTTDTPQPIVGFDFILQEGDFWEYAWVYKQTTTSTTTSSESDVGNFRITLGTAQSLAGKIAFPVIISGKRTDPAGITYAGNLTHIALENNQVLISTDGITLKVIFDANTAIGTGGIFTPLGVLGATDITSLNMDNQFIKDTDAYRIGGSTDDPLCDSILGETICGDEASSITEYEYYKPGIGPISYYLLTTNTYTGGGFTTYHRTEKTLGIIDSSLSATDGFSPANYPWRIKAEIPITNFDTWFTAGAALNGKIYVVYNGELHIYDPATDVWIQGPNMTIPGNYAPVALAYFNKIYVFQGQDIYTFDPVTNKWTKLIFESFGIDLTLHQYAVGMLQNNGSNRYGVFFDTNGTAVYFHDFLLGEHVLWSSISYPILGENYRSLAIHNNLVYSFGGSYGYQGTWGWVTNYYAQSYSIDPYIISPSWVPITNMPTARSGAMSVVYGDKIYVIGGGGESNSYASYAIEEYDVPSNSWTIKSSSFLKLGYGLAFEVNGKIYIIDNTYVLEYSLAADE